MTAEIMRGERIFKEDHHDDDDDNDDQCKNWQRFCNGLSHGSRCM